MISLLEHIEFLITGNDCVIVPGWGAFIAQYTPAQRLSCDGFSRPQRKIGFNASVTYNDGLLANSLMRRERMSYDEANELINSVVSGYRRQLQHEGEVSFGRLGMFKRNAEGNMEFVPYNNASLNDQFYGLMSFKMMTLSELSAAKKQEEETVTDEAEEEVEEHSNILPFTRDFMKMAASIAVLVVLTLFLSTPISIKHDQNYASLNDAFNVHLQSSKQISIGVPPVNEVKAAPVQVVDTVAPVESAAKDVEVKPAEKVVEEKPAEPVENFDDVVNAEQGKSYLVVASFKKLKTARKFIEQEKNSKYKIVHTKKMYCIFIKSGSYNKVHNYKKNMDGNVDAWIYSEAV